MIRQGLTKEVISEQRPKWRKGQSHVAIGEGCFWQREQEVQRPWARSALGEPMEELVSLEYSK